MSKPWLKSWACSLDKRKVMSLPGDLFKVWQVLQWVAARYDKDGLLPSLDDCAFTMRKDEEWITPLVAQLVERELLDATPEGYRMHDWDEWQTRKPSDEPERVKERVYRHREAKKDDVTPVTPSNALQNVTKSVTPRNARNAVKSESREEENREEEGIEPTVLARAGRTPSAKQATHMSIVVALQECCNWDTSKPGTKNELARLHANAKQIAEACGTPDDVQVRAENYVERWGADKLTPNSLVGHWTECATNAPARASPNGHVSPGDRVRDSVLRVSREFMEATGGSDEPRPVPNRDGTTGNSVRAGTEQRAVARVLGPPPDRQR